MALTHTYIIRNRMPPMSTVHHHAAEPTVLLHHHGHGCGNRCESGTYQRNLLHIERSHEPALLAPHANQASYPCKGTALYPDDQPCHVHRRGYHHPALSRLLAHGGSLRTRHHHHHADDHPAARFLPAQQGRWCTVLIGGILFLMMYVWVRAMKIRRHYISAKPLDDYYQIISDIKTDESIPKYASNLVYINHANQEGTVDDKLLYSIINKQPKRADHYWLINMEFADTPDTLEYSCETLVPDTLYSITMHIGFRIEPRVSLYLRQVVEDLVASKKVDLRSTYPSLRKNRIPGDFRFIIIHRVYYPESSGNRQQNLLMTLYALISKIGIDDPKALGLDTSMVVVERVPLIIDQSNRSVRRIIQIAEEK